MTTSTEGTRAGPALRLRLPEKPRWTQWNHNQHYHRFLLDQMPAGCQVALDVGCGAGRLAVRMTERAQRVVALDRDAAILEVARRVSAHPRVAYLEADLLDAGLEAGSFGFIACLAALHHMPFAVALVRMRRLLAAGGVLAVVGLYRYVTAADYLHYAAVVPVDLALGALRHRREERAGVLPRAPLRPPGMTLAAIRAQAEATLPGSVVRRHMYYRYSLLYRAP